MLQPNTHWMEPKSLWKTKEYNKCKHLKNNDNHWLKSTNKFHSISVLEGEELRTEKLVWLNPANSAFHLPADFVCGFWQIHKIEISHTLNSQFSPKIWMFFFWFFMKLKRTFQIILYWPPTIQPTLLCGIVLISDRSAHVITCHLYLNGLH